MNARDIVKRAWLELPAADRDLLKEIRADQWEICDRPLGTHADRMLRSAGCDSLSTDQVASRNEALALWVPDLLVVLINERHPAFDNVNEPTAVFNLSRIAWHEWGHALSFHRAEEEDIAAGERYVDLLPPGMARLVRQAGYRRREYTHEVVAEVYSMLMARRRLGQVGKPPWLHAEIYELVRRVAGWTQ